jgi:transcriptional regulator GlxA family with amidase domain
LYVLVALIQAIYLYVELTFMAVSKQIVFFVPPGVLMLDLSGPVQAFWEAGQLTGLYDVSYCSFKPEIQDASGLHLSHLKHYSEIHLNKGDYLFIPGFSAKLLHQLDEEVWEKFYAWIRLQVANGILVCSVCVGAFVLARAGLLDKKRCTTHWNFTKKLQDDYPAAQVEEDTLFTQDGGIYTSAGISSGIDLALFILEENHGALFAHKIAREMVVYSRRGANHSQVSVYLNYRNHLHNGIHHLQDWLIDNLASPATIEQMAERSNMSSRNLTRTFRLQTGISINEYITQLRLEKADMLRNSPGITISAIARQCGFRNERQLQRIWKKRSV